MSKLYTVEVMTIQKIRHKTTAELDIAKWRNKKVNGVLYNISTKRQKIKRNIHIGGVKEWGRVLFLDKRSTIDLGVTGEGI